MWKFIYLITLLEGFLWSSNQIKHSGLAPAGVVGRMGAQVDGSPAWGMPQNIFIYELATTARRERGFTSIVDRAKKVPAHWVKHNKMLFHRQILLQLVSYSKIHPEACFTWRVKYQEGRNVGMVAVRQESIEGGASKSSVRGRTAQLQLASAAGVRCFQRTASERMCELRIHHSLQWEKQGFPCSSLLFLDLVFLRSSCHRLSESILRKSVKHKASLGSWLPS